MGSWKEGIAYKFDVHNHLLDPLPFLLINMVYFVSHSYITCECPSLILFPHFRQYSLSHFITEILKILSYTNTTSPCSGWSCIATDGQSAM